MQRKKISAFIIALNEEKNIDRALQSLSWCDEVIVVDSGSTDKTEEICRKHGAKFIHHQWPGYAAQKQFALGECSNEWVLNIDADEEVSPTLRDKIEEILYKDIGDSDNPDGYKILRKVFFLGKWWERGGWYPEYRLRFMRKAKAKWGGVDPHEKAEVSGKIGIIKEPIYHYTYRSFEDEIKVLNNFSSLMASKIKEEGKPRLTLVKAFINPLLRFIKFYIIKRGFLEGIPGLLVAINESYYVFLKYIKLWELLYIGQNADFNRNSRHDA